MTTDHPPERESGWEQVAGIVALLFWSVVLVEGLGTVAIVGLSDVSPRAAAAIMLAPTFLVWVIASCQRRFRQAATILFPPIF